MSIRTVATRDLRNAGRSPALWGGAIGLGLLGVGLAFVNRGRSQSPTVAVESLFDVLTILLALLLPLAALVASYLAIAGERESGGIKFLLSVPNGRRDVFLGKLLSRLLIATVGVGFAYAPATSVSLSKYGAFPAAVVFGTLAVTLVYAAVFVVIGVSLSATVASRNSAIGRSLLAYFLLVLFYIFPVIQVSNVVRTVHTELLGMDANADLYNAVEFTSPYLAYQKTLNLVLPEGMENEFFSDSTEGGDTGDPGGSTVEGGGPGSGGESAGSTATSEPGEVATELPVYLTDEFALVILAFWLVVPLVLGYRSFAGADLE
ncbi:MAG: hypothetical protein J07HX64_02060 [halophilic archaeon J07HX64]|nr:MAG: hypothetical protein J07HX64_02060 [halophilic archaeon J07HX64]